jgi:hypothetical protein
MNAKERRHRPGPGERIGIVGALLATESAAFVRFQPIFYWRQRPVGNSSASSFANSRSISMPISPSCGELMNLISSMLS